MYPLTLPEAKSLFLGIKKTTSKLKKTEAVICAPYPFIETLRKFSSKQLLLGAQNIFAEKLPAKGVGAITGEVSALMASELGARYVILGHSERRLLGETNEEINQKIKIALKTKLMPIVCVGEGERDANGGYLAGLKKQIEETFKGLTKADFKKLIVAYEPIWAISSSKDRHDATPEDCLEMVIFIKKVLRDEFKLGEGEQPRFVYGGSANSKNAEGFLQNGGVTGLLSGRASLHPDEFGAMLKIAEKLK